MAARPPGAFQGHDPRGERDGGLPERLREPDELAGVLAWAVRGCMDWRSDGLQPPEAVLTATAEYRAEQDPIAPFLEARCVADPRGRTTSKALYADYRAWCAEAEEPEVSETAFGLALREKGFRSERGGKRRTRGWVGVRLQAEAVQEDMLDS